MHGIGRGGRALAAGMLAMPFLYLAVFYAWPILHVAWLSLRDVQPAYDTDDFVGLQNFRDLLGATEAWHTILRTFVYTFVCVTGSFVLGLAFALLTTALARAFPGRPARWLRQILVTPMLFIPAAAGVMWSFAFTEHYGWVNHLLTAIGLSPYPWLASRGAFALVMLTDIWGWTPFMYLILLAALQTLPPEPLEAARVDGASAWQTLWHVILPMLRPVIVVALTMKTLDTYRAFDYLWIMTHGGPGTSATTLAIAIYKTAFMNLDFGAASAMAVIAMAFPVVVVVGFLMLRRERPA